MIKAITFDLDGVYFINGKANFIAELEKLNVPREEAERVFLKSPEMNQLYKTGKMTDSEFWGWAAKEWRLEMTPEELVNLLIKGYERDEAVLETVKKVRENGYKTLICSNNFPARVEGLQKKFGFLDNFDATVISYQIGHPKPNREIFEALVKKAGVRAEEIVFADDNENNLIGAREAGINAFFYENFDQFKEELKKLGVKI